MNNQPRTAPVIVCLAFCMAQRLCCSSLMVEGVMMPSNMGCGLWTLTRYHLQLHNCCSMKTASRGPWPLLPLRTSYCTHRVKVLYPYPLIKASLVMLQLLAMQIVSI